MEKTSQHFIPALEGIRGYAFIIVFLVHYQASSTKPDHVWQYPWFLLLNTGWLVVPLFFALSGYLITLIFITVRAGQDISRFFMEDMR